MGHRKYLGAGIKTTDNGRVIDINTVIPITDPRHTLYARHDPTRYSLDNPSFRALVDWVVAHGAIPQPVMFRQNGLLGQSDREWAYIKATYPKELLEQPEQPKLELVYGNRRWHALKAAQEIAAKNGMEPIGGRMLAVYAALKSDDEMEEVFVRENAARAKTSIYEDQLTIRAALKRLDTWSEIASTLVQPEKELRRIHEPLTEAHLAVVQAFSAGTINRSRALRIIKAAPSVQAQTLALEDDDVVPKAPPKRKRVYLDEIPLEAIRSLAAGEPSEGPVSKWLRGLS